MPRRALLTRHAERVMVPAMLHIDPAVLIMGAAWLLTAVGWAVCSIRRMLWNRRARAANLSGRVANLESALQALRAEVVSHRAALKQPPARDLLRPPPLPQPSEPFWTRALTMCAPEHHAPYTDFYPPSP